jgi:hypothetical protein
MIKIDAHKIEYQPKNKHLFKIIIPIKINNAVCFPSNQILKNEIKKKKN